MKRSSLVGWSKNLVLLGALIVGTACGSTIVEDVTVADGGADPAVSQGGAGGGTQSSDATSTTQTTGSGGDQNTSDASPQSSASASRDGDEPHATVIDPVWERTNEFFLAPAAPTPDLQYYSVNTYPLFNEDNTPAGSGFTWMSGPWNGPSTSDMPLDGPDEIPGFVPNDTWFWTYDRAGDGRGTTYWFRANVDLGSTSSLKTITLEDKYHPGRLAINDGVVIFIDGVAQPIMPTVSSQGDPRYGSGLVQDDSETGWTFDGVALSPQAFHDGTNEVAVMYEEREGDGGLGHLALRLVPST